MDRDEVAAVLILPVCAILLWVSGRAFSRPNKNRSEEDAWRAVWLPMVTPLLALAALVGAAVSDPEAPHAFSAERGLIALPTLLLFARAGVRAVRSLRTSDGLAHVRGLFRPSVVIDDSFREQLTHDELRAVILHEEAHARHFDPARIWAARIATDLQWPFAAAEARYTAWANALELERDRNACDEGADSLSLASALVKAARNPVARTAHHAALADNAPLLEVRIAALLDSTATETPRRSQRRGFILLLASAGAFVVGLLNGGEIISLLVGG